MHILLTNDDGIRAQGIKALYAALVAANHQVDVVAPMRQQSGVGQCLTVFEPVRVKTYTEGAYTGTGLYGTPADCVKLALGELLKTPPDLVVSGINLGANVGPDVLYSGTIAAAIEGMLAKFPSIAVSLDDHNARDLTKQAAHFTRLLAQIDWAKVPEKRVLNVNYPKGDFATQKGLRICSQSKATWLNSYTARLDPRGATYYWLDGDIAQNELEENCDLVLLREGYITLTPLYFDFNDQEGLDILKSMDLS
ncbi:MAG: 5'/3'-nucleotidase SurE [Desulfovibrionaceae bacterium]|nr:5'/3'-nucleotidase SurE [Desulfovibrionaceae bacterium]